MRKIWLLEPDHAQAGAWTREIVVHLLDCEVEVIPTEAAFRTRLENVGTEPPAALITECLVFWLQPGEPGPPMPEDVLRDGPGMQGEWRAGFRCQKLLAAHPVTRDVPVIFHAIAEEGDFPDELAALTGNFRFVEKYGDGRLIRTLRELIGEAVRT